MCKTTTSVTRILFIILFVFVCLTENTFASSVITPIPVRKFSLELDSSVSALGSLSLDQKVEGRLKEYSGGVLIKDWKIKLDKKGHSRDKCEPLMFNLTFDKTDSEGNKKPLFNGRSTYGGNSTLEYQELRFIPDCDIWNGPRSVHTMGFKGSLSSQTREGFAHMVFRRFGVATPDVVTFADITFISADPVYSGKTFRYMVLQRVDEEDDQIPFTKQFGLKTTIYKEGRDGPYYMTESGNDRLDKITILDNRDNLPITLNLDNSNAVRLRILSEFIDLGDVWFLQNESYGVKASDNKTLIIPHSLDSSFSCTFSSPEKTVGGYKKAMMLENSNMLNFITKKIYYEDFQKIFTNINNLYVLEQIVNSFPGKQSEKQQLKNFLRIRFHQFASYAVSTEFAMVLNQPYVKKTVTLPFLRTEGYQYAYDTFMKNCGVTRSETPVSPVSSQTNNLILKD